MKWVMIIFSFLVLVFACVTQIGLSQVAIDDTGITPDFLAYLVSSFNGLKGASALGASAILIQVILKALNQPFAGQFFGKLTGLQKLAIVGGLTFAITPIGLMSGAGLTAGAALVHSATLTAFTVFLNQIWKQATAESNQPENKK